MIVVDTNILVDILRRKPRGQQWLDFLKDKPVTFTTVTAYELFLGAELSIKQVENLKKVQDLVQKYPVLPLTLKSAFLASKIQAKLQKNGNIIDVRDLYIAAITLENSARLATSNIKHFERIDNLKLVTL